MTGVLSHDNVRSASRPALDKTTLCGHHYTAMNEPNLPSDQPLWSLAEQFSALEQRLHEREQALQEEDRRLREEVTRLAQENAGLRERLAAEATNNRAERQLRPAVITQDDRLQPDGRGGRRHTRF